MTTPDPAFLSAVKWEVQEPPDEPSDIPYATHSGVLEICGGQLRCYRLSNGQAVFNADDFAAFMNNWMGLP